MHFYISSLWCCVGCALTLALLAWSRRPARGAVALSLFLFCISLASFAYAQNLTAAGLEQKLFWNHLEYLGGAFLPGLMLVIALLFTGHEAWVRPRPMGALFSVPVLAVLANWTNTWHHLYYRAVWLDSLPPFTLLAKLRGPLYLLFFFSAYVLLGLALVLLARAWRRAPPALRPQQALLLVAFLPPILLNLPYLLHWMPQTHLNLTLLGFSVSGLLLLVGLCRFKLLAALPLDLEERNDLLLDHAEAIIYTITPAGIMTYVSANWPRLLGHPEAHVVGRSFSQFVHPDDLPACYAFLDHIVQSSQPQRGVEYRVLHQDGTLYWHTSSIRPVRDQRGRVVAYVGAAHDITQLKVMQLTLRDAHERLEQLVARRDEELREAAAQALTAADGEARRIGEKIHDTLCQDLVALNRALAAVQPANAGQQEQLAGLTALSAQVTQQAREVAHDMALHELTAQNFPAMLAALAERLEKLFHCTVEVNCERWPADLPASKAEHMFRIVREACGNAVKHGQATQVWIDVVREENSLVLSISNNGRPLAVPEPQPGLGLRQMTLRARLLGGLITLHSTEDSTTAQLVVPLPSTQPVQLYETILKQKIRAGGG